MPVRHQNGFTLVELLVALSLLALTGLISWKGLDHVARQRSRAELETQATEQVMRTLAQLDRDFGQRVPDALFLGATQGSGRVLPLAIDISGDTKGNARLTLLRMYRGASRNVIYIVDGTELVRHSSSEDPAGDRDSVLMLGEVQRLEVRLLIDGRWTEPRESSAGGRRASAVEIAIERSSGERYVEVLQL
jgi:type II secretion system protein J